ncbi:MAG: helix-turn-helix domain-containing protein [bacterium]|nr:helix-turn-helix domain-containing protein [bacterium]
MTTVGEILKNKRLEKKLNLIDVEKTIKVRSKFLIAIENNDFSNLPPATFTRGFIKNYAVYLGLNSEEILAFYRRQENMSKEKILPQSPTKFSQKFKITPPVITAVGVGLLLLFFFGYLFRQYFLYTGTPSLTVTSPADYVIVKTPSVEVTGKTDTDTVLTINDQEVMVKETGEFSVKIDLAPGLNTFNILSVNKFKKETKIVRHVRLESP